MASLIEPRTLKGFRDYLPQLMLPRERVLQTAREVYRRYGYAPIDTPALEYAEVLLGKGGEESDRLVYRFQDHGERDVALRFDLTVPFARFSAQWIPQLGTPFKRYAMGPVWRGENTSAGRYREFWQCDFDTIGTTANQSDIEVVLVIHELLLALGIERFTIRVNQRLILNGLLEAQGLLAQSVPVLRALDKLLKIGPEGVLAEFQNQAGLSESQGRELLRLIAIPGDAEEQLTMIEASPNASATALEGVKRLRELFAVADAVGIPKERLQLDLSIARGLDYYTGTIYETFLTDLTQIGSICSGGRYDNLAGLYTKQVLPGVGASLGVDRLLAALETLQHPWLQGSSTPAEVLMLQVADTPVGVIPAQAARLRAAGLSVEVYPESAKLPKQFQYAEKRGHAFAVIIGATEASQQVAKVKQLSTRIERTLPWGELGAEISSLLRASSHVPPSGQTSGDPAGGP